MSDAGGLQLLPNDKKHFEVSLSGKSGFLIVAIVILLLIGGAYMILSSMITSAEEEVAGIDSQILAIYKKRNKTEEEKLLNFEKQLTTMRNLLTAHTTWSLGFRGVQSLIQPRVTFESFNADARSKKYTFHAISDSYTTVAKQVAAFYATDMFSDIKLNKVSEGGNGQVDFTMDLQFKPDGFLFKSSKK